MPNILFPNVPAYPGVPLLVRPAQVAIASNPAIAISIGTLSNVLGDAVQQAPQWGIFDAGGNQLGVTSNSATRGQLVLQALARQVAGHAQPVLSTLSFGFAKETRVADFLVEGGTFASYNKVALPANPVVTLVLDGSEDDRTDFLLALDAACDSTDAYSVVTPEITYVNYTIERYVYARRANQGANLLIVDVSLKQIREVSASFATVATQINKPQNPAATPQVNNGMTQPQAPDQSTALSLVNKLKQLAGVN